MARSFKCWTSPFIRNMFSEFPGHRKAYILLNRYSNVACRTSHRTLSSSMTSKGLMPQNCMLCHVRRLSSLPMKPAPTGSITLGINRPPTDKPRYFHEDNKTTALTVLGTLKELKSSPGPALVLGFAGLIPFVTAPTYMVTNQVFMPDSAFTQLVYGAVILSFLGGVRWGMTIPDDGILRPNWFNLGYSVCPSLIAWAGVLMPSPFSVLTVIGGLAGAAYMDMVSYGYPPWFKGLRFILTFVAILSLWTTLMCGYLLSTKNDTKTKEQIKK